MFFLNCEHLLYRELQALKVEKEQEVDRSISRTQEELHVLRQKLEQAETDRERDVSPSPNIILSAYFYAHFS